MQRPNGESQLACALALFMGALFLAAMGLAGALIPERYSWLAIYGAAAMVSLGILFLVTSWVLKAIWFLPSRTDIDAEPSADK